MNKHKTISAMSARSDRKRHSPSRALELISLWRELQAFQIADN
jgi:hypothetical protein